MRTDVSQRNHDALIARLVNELEEKGYTDIRADHLAGYEDRRPDKIYSDEDEMYFTPDVSARRGIRRCYFEVETGDSLNRKVTDTELRAFAGLARLYGDIVYLVVPQSLCRAAQSLSRKIKETEYREFFVICLDDV